MNESRISKFENPVRIEELSPEKTLLKAGLKEGMVLCDIGAGTGVFSFPATKITKHKIYALELSDSMIEILKNRRNKGSIKNLEIKKVESDILPLESNSCDMAIMVTVLHEIENKEFMLQEVIRILEEKGRFMVIEFHKRKTPMGPPIDHRISIEYVTEICNSKGLKILEQFSLGENFYATIFES